jgi:hypothetical protein
MFTGGAVFDGLQGVAAGIMRACGRQFLGAMLNLSCVRPAPSSRRGG